MPPRRAADVLHDLFCRFLHRPGFLSHLRSFKGYDEPEILPSSTRRICLIGADAGHTGHSVDSRVDRQGPRFALLLNARSSDEQLSAACMPCAATSSLMIPWLFD